MLTHQRVIAILSLITIQSLSALAETPPVKMGANEAFCGGQTLLRNGTGIRSVTVFGIQIYRGTLFVKSPSNSANEIINSHSPKLMRFAFLRSASTDRLRDGWREGLKKNASQIDPKLVEEFVNIIPAVEEGAVIEICIAQGSTAQDGIARESASISVNGTQAGIVNDPGLAHALLSVWLGSEPPSEKFKLELLNSR